MYENHKVKGIKNYAEFEDDGTVNITTQSERERIMIQGSGNSSNGAYILPKDAVVFSLCVDGGSLDVRITSAAQVLAEDLSAAKAVVFDVQSYGEIGVLYIVEPVRFN
jgi:hypothetical protein